MHGWVITYISSRCSPLTNHELQTLRTLRTLRDVAGVMDITDIVDVKDTAGVTDVMDITGGTVRHMAYLGKNLTETYGLGRDHLKVK